MTASRLQETPEPAPHADPFYQAEKSRLKALEGRRCPLCRFGSVHFDGYVLRCDADHTWSNAQAAEDELK